MTADEKPGMGKIKPVLENESECLEFLHLTKRLRGSPDFPPSIIVDLYIILLNCLLHSASNFGRKEYLASKSIDNCRMMMRMRSKMMNVKENFKNKKEPD